MDTHTESAVAEAPAEEQAELPLADTAINELPQDQDANLSFNDALESALSKLSGADQTETPTEEVAEPQEEQPEF